MDDKQDRKFSVDRDDSLSSGLICSLCQRHFEKKAARLSHEKHCGKRQRHVCSICKDVFGSVLALRNHIGRKHDPASDTNDKIEYTCAKCERQFVRKTFYKQHTESCNGLTSGKFCKICNVKFSSENNLRRHVKRRHGKNENLRNPNRKQEDNSQKEEVELKCKNCGSLFQRTSSLQKHVKQGCDKWVTLVDGLSCKTCDYKFSCMSNLIRHMRRRHKDALPALSGESGTLEDERNEVKLPCSMCAKECATKTGLKVHERACMKVQENRTCKVCKMKFHNTFGMKRHFKKKHNNLTTFNNGNMFIKTEDRACLDISQDGDGVKCSGSLNGQSVNAIDLKKESLAQDMDTEFPKEGHLSDVVDNLDGSFKARTVGDHLKKADIRNTEEFKCDICGKPFSSKLSLFKHRYYHDARKREHSARNSNNSDGGLKLNNHLQQHKDKVYCHVCGSAFETRSGFNKHMRAIHLGIRYSCRICKKEFLHSFTLKGHMKLHEGLKPYVCEICGKTCAQKHQLLRHQKIHTFKGERNYKCNFCQKTFQDVSAVRAHQKIHTGFKLYGCKFCSYTCAHASALKVHEKIHFMRRDFKCSICERAFTQKVTLKKHMMLHESRRSKPKPAYFTKPTLFCDKCPKGFITKRGLVRHKQNHEMGLLKSDTIKRVVSINEDDQCSVQTIPQSDIYLQDHNNQTNVFHGRSNSDRDGIPDASETSAFVISNEGINDQGKTFSSSSTGTTQNRIISAPSAVSSTLVKTEQLLETTFKKLHDDQRASVSEPEASTRISNRELSDVSRLEDGQRAGWNSFRFSQSPGFIPESTVAQFEKESNSDIPVHSEILNALADNISYTGEEPSEVSDVDTVIEDYDIASNIEVVDMKETDTQESDKHELADLQDRKTLVEKLDPISKEFNFVSSKTEGERFIKQSVDLNKAVDFTSTDCNHCPVSFCLKSSLMNHIRRAHRNETLPSHDHQDEPVDLEKSYYSESEESSNCEVQCMKCKRQFYSVLDLKAHVKHKCVRKCNEITQRQSMADQNLM